MLHPDFRAGFPEDFPGIAETFFNLPDIEVQAFLSFDLPDDVEKDQLGNAVKPPEVGQCVFCGF